MKKNLVAVVVLLIIVALGARAFVALFGYQVLEKLKVSKQSELSLTYNWLSSDFSGQLIIHDVVLTPFALKRSIEIEQLVLDYGDYFNLLLGLPELKTGWFGRLKSVSTRNAVIPLEGRGLDEWLALEFGDAWSNVFGIYACGDRKRIGHDELSAMGIDEIKADLSLDVDRTGGLDSVITRISADLGEMGQTRMRSEWLAESFSDQLGGWSLQDLTLQSAMIEHIEKGYFRRLSNFCLAQSSLDRSAFASLAAFQWRQAMADIGVNLGHASEQLYGDYLRLGGALNLSVSSTPPFRLGSYRKLAGRNLTQRFSVVADLNGNQTKPMMINLEKDIFETEPIAPDESEEEAATPADTEVVSSVPAHTKSFKASALTDLENYLGHKIRVQAKSGKMFTGTLKHSDENSVKIAHALQKGEVVYNVATEEIAVVEIWR